MASVTCVLTDQDQDQLGKPNAHIEYGTTFVFTYSRSGRVSQRFPRAKKIGDCWIFGVYWTGMFYTGWMPFLWPNQQPVCWLPREWDKPMNSSSMKVPLLLISINIWICWQMTKSKLPAHLSSVRSSSSWPTRWCKSRGSASIMPVSRSITSPFFPSTSTPVRPM